MPRHVDPEQRRHDVAQATWRVILRAGLAKASVRAVAEEAGLSVGSLRHYFSEQRELQIYAFELINERAAQRLAAVAGDLPVRDRIEQTMWALLPVTPAQVEEQQIALAFLVESRTDPALAEIVAQDRAAAVDLTRGAILALREAGLADPAVDVETATVELRALLDGLAHAAALHPADMPGHLIRAAVRSWLDGLAP
ncbi:MULTISPECIES: TetR/AcrR family transcriptional regulator [Brevibacterium]|uniref:TetR/AcrR family transcriptional regulator n=1 Tax=Brevibacterium TaxID=1696 RepID=UPI0025B81EEA|nr:TetR family transcriptional regulator C-terminal domain-containing protein [Brevibacterium sp.]